MTGLCLPPQSRSLLASEVDLPDRVYMRCQIPQLICHIRFKLPREVLVIRTKLEASAFGHCEKVGFTDKRERVTSRGHRGYHYFNRRPSMFSLLGR